MIVKIMERIAPFNLADGAEFPNFPEEVEAERVQPSFLKASLPEKG